MLRLTGHTDGISSAVWSKDESKILTSSYDGTARIWDASTGKGLLKLTGNTGAVNSAVWSKDESKILTSSDDKTARIWDASTGKELLKLTGGTATIPSFYSHKVFAPTFSGHMQNLVAVNNRQSAGGA